MPGKTSFNNRPSTPRFLVVGAGFSGAVIARRLVELLPGAACEVWDERPHLAGNCHTERDPATGVMVHAYGPHIFNTDNARVWEFVNQFGDFRPFINRVKAHTSRGAFSLPINLHTLNQFFGKTFRPSEAAAFVRDLSDQSIGEPRNLEEQALKMLGRDLYETFFKGYTIKQWGCDPKELPASILKRLPVRFSYDDNYYDKRFQGIPAEGYTEVVRRILDHPGIRVHLKKAFTASAFEDFSLSAFSHIFCTGPLDAFFRHCFGRLSYRTVTFERVETDESDYQGNAVINYPDLSVPWTRVHEHKHFAPWETHERTVAFREYSKETGPEDVPYYPKRLAADKALLGRYRRLAEETAARADGAAGVSFLGRLGTYRYMDMETVIGEALDFAGAFASAWSAREPLPVFPNEER